ncbi:MAG: decaprenyl-phosphate phosphoribosyltransferase [Pseudonocardiales bacterium]|nr:decaprenyl-phosphate phosphoribosyltransferase [Pseudonocardiales bacterium]
MVICRVPAPPTGRVDRPSLALGLIRAARPKQWTKNVLVFAAPGAAGQLGDLDTLGRTLIAFLAFCLAASGTYYLNDAADVESDRRHPSKSKRPMAAGVFTPRTGRLVGTGLLLASISLAVFCTRWQLAVVIAIYIANTTAYSIWLKHMPVYDILSVASGFLLRAVGGGAASGIALSDWFLTVALFGSLFMVAGKRFAEHTAFADAEDGHVREVMKHYTGNYLSYVRTVASSSLLLAYCLFAFQKSAASTGDFPWYQLSVLPFVAAILRYALLLEGGKGESPEDVVFEDRSLILLGLCWVGLFFAGTYFGS